MNHTTKHLGRRARRLAGGPAFALCRIGWLALALAVPSARADDWLTGPPLARQLASSVTVAWSGSPLRTALERLAQAQRVAVLLDRRVDPGRPIELRLLDAPLVDVFEELAAREGLGVTLLDAAVYFGPPETARKLRTLSALKIEEARGLPSAISRKALARAAMRWENLATPRELIERLAAEIDLRADGLDRVPHDLWAAADLPPLAWVDRMILVVAQFDLSFELSAADRTLRLVPMPERLAVVRSYPAGNRGEELARRSAQLAPGAEVKLSGGKVWVKGLVEDHERLSGLKRSATPETSPSGAALDRRRIDRMSVRDVPVGDVLAQLARQLRFELRIDQPALQRAGVSLDQRISVSVENVSVDELLQAVIRDTPLRFRRSGDVVEIGPAGAP